MHSARYTLVPFLQIHSFGMMWFFQSGAETNTSCACYITAVTKSEHDNVLPTLLKLLDIDSHVIHPELNMLV